MPLDAQASNKQIQWAKQLAKEQLTDKQELCHHEIVFRESTWNYKAIGNIGGTKQTYGFFQQNLVSEYTYPQSVADGVNVDFEVYRIKTKISGQRRWPL
jgi:hypothetical protein